MKNSLLLGLLLVLAACGKPPEDNSQAQPAAQEATQPASAEAPSKPELFQRAVDRILIATEAVKGECATLLGNELMGAIGKMSTGVSAPVCGKLTLSPDATRQIITIRYGEVQVAPWEGESPFTSAIFSYGDNALLTTLIFPNEGVLVLGSD